MTPWWLRQAILAADRRQCAYRHYHTCAGPLQVDHVKPRAWGGRSVPWNLAVLCRDANRTKSGYYQDGRGREHYRPWPGYDDLRVARAILATEKRRRLNPARYARALAALTRQ